MKEIADELGRLRKLSLHPWAQLDAETETGSLLGGPSTAKYRNRRSYYFWVSYAGWGGEDLPMNPMSSYYGR